jgi:hypothetical protein
MPSNDDLLNQGPREAPEPETAEERSHRLGMKTAGGAVVGGGVAVAKLGFLSKALIWLFAWNAFKVSWYYGGWIVAAAVVLLVLAIYVMHKRGEAR